MSVQIVTLDDVSPLVPGPAVPGAPPPTLPGMLQPPAGQILYAIVDAGLFDWVIYEIGDSGRSGVCLFDVSQDRAVEEHAPWLVDLGAQPGLARKFMTRGEEPWTTWGRPGILYLHSAASLGDLRAHFRRIVQIPRVDQGGHVFLRFWTQDILHDLCAAVSDDWTGPLRVFGAEGAPLVTACFLPAGEGAALVRIDAPKALPGGRLVYDERMETVLRDTMRRRFAAELSAHCEEVFPDRLKAIPEEARTEVFLQVMAQGRRYGLTQRGPLVVWAEASLLLGALAIDDHAVRPLLDRGLGLTGDQMTRATALNRDLVAYAEACLGPGNACLRAALGRIEAAVAGDGDMAAMLARVWPEKVAFIGAEAFQLFVAQVTGEAQRYRPDRVNERVFALLCLFLGAGVARDPLHGWLATALAAPMDRGADSQLCRSARVWMDAAAKRLEALA
ncbi:hypothetical protein GCM10011360_05600 [Primorskyibacter flagellatus]|uniref:DUF4123 domain-containing protein n=1 Tax=Primorskyibacter flagellatus TaxID=1387277 RepID=A0A916ZZ53_9RHOB|nr:DUF4123 domain-containing protein [Primorskyibacter flagellatus]GGE19724.1 hypothetical protein GCM10011360_05600 [Primorskyibacter flagellatus]